MLTIKQTISELKITVNAIQEKLEEAEGRIHHLEDATEGLINNRDRDEKRMDAMWNRLQMLENHSKRNNVRLVGLKETYGTNGTMVSCVRRVLSEGLGIDVDGEFEVERAHRSPAPVPNDGQPPRPVLFRILRQSASDKVVRKEKLSQPWREHCSSSTWNTHWLIQHPCDSCGRGRTKSSPIQRCREVHQD